jgi:hypothetical protein
MDDAEGGFFVKIVGRDLARDYEVQGAAGLRRLRRSLPGDADGEGAAGQDSGFELGTEASHWALLLIYGYVFVAKIAGSRALPDYGMKRRLSHL